MCQVKVMATFSNLLIFGLFLRVNIYNILRVWFFKYDSNFFYLMYLNKSRYILKTSKLKAFMRESCRKNLKITRLKLILGRFTNPKFHRVYHQKCNELDYNFFTKCTPIYPLNMLKISRFEVSQKTIREKIPLSFIWNWFKDHS